MRLQVWQAIGFAVILALLVQAVLYWQHRRARKHTAAGTSRSAASVSLVTNIHIEDFRMTDEEAYSVQAYGSLLEFALATYEGLMERRTSSKIELARHKEVIRAAFTEMGPTLLNACGHFDKSNRSHPQWKHNVRLKVLLKDLLLSGLTAEAVVNIYLKEAEEHRARHV
jgi:hypothetical protein